LFFTVYAGLNTISLVLMALRLLKVLHFQPRIGLVTRTLAAGAVYSVSAVRCSILHILY
jgi:hypothetical protein